MIPSRVAAVPFASGPGASKLLAWDHPGSPGLQAFRSSILPGVSADR